MIPTANTPKLNLNWFLIRKLFPIFLLESTSPLKTILFTNTKKKNFSFQNKDKSSLGLLFSSSSKLKNY